MMLQPHDRTKLEPRARLCCFLGYGIEHKGYRCWDSISQRLRISRHVVFWDHKMFSSLSAFEVSRTGYSYFTNLGVNLFPDVDAKSMEVQCPTLEQPVSHEDASVPDPAVDSLNASPEPMISSSDCSTSSTTLADCSSSLASSTTSTLRRSSPVSHPLAYLQDYQCYSVLATIHEPQTFKEAQYDPKWQNAMQEELEALHKTHTWDIVDLPPDKSAIACKRVYKIKTRSDG